MSQKENLPEEILQRLFRKGIAFWDHFRIFESSKDERSMLQAEAMHFLNENPASKMSQIAKHLSISTPATTLLVDRMVKNRIITREPSKTDRRQVEINLTKEGRFALEQIQKDMRDEFKEIFKGIDASEAEKYMGTQDKIIRNMDTLLKARGLKK